MKRHFIIFMVTQSQKNLQIIMYHKVHILLVLVHIHLMVVDNLIMLLIDMATYIHQNNHHNHNNLKYLNLYHYHHLIVVVVMKMIYNVLQQIH